MNLFLQVSVCVVFPALSFKKETVHASVILIQIQLNDNIQSIHRLYYQFLLPKENCVWIFSFLTSLTG